MSQPFPHELIDVAPRHGVRVELRPVHDRAGNVVEGLHKTWVILDEPGQLTTYTPEMVRAVVQAFAAASNDPRCVNVVLTSVVQGATDSNDDDDDPTSPRDPVDPGQSRLFNELLAGILTCEKPVICRVIGDRGRGGQAIGMMVGHSMAGEVAHLADVREPAGPLHSALVHVSLRALRFVRWLPAPGQGLLHRLAGLVHANEEYAPLDAR